MRYWTIYFILIFSLGQSYGQEDLPLLSLKMADSLHKPRLIAVNTAGAVFYTGSAITLASIWYDEYEQTSFHLFNDMGEWEDLDKLGHVATAYIESKWAFQCERWAGLDRRSSMWAAMGIGTLFQTTVEVMDGFSEKWGFSIPDMASNMVGVSLFGLQEHYWQEQRIILKISSTPVSYPDLYLTSADGSESSLRGRAKDLFGDSWGERFLKDYNAQTIWASFNINSFLKQEPAWIPSWLNLAVGYGAENMFGGFANQWPSDDPQFHLPESTLSRYRQFYLSFDIDLDRIKTRSPFVKTLLGILNIIKIPSPTLELTSQGDLHFHPIFW